MENFARPSASSSRTLAAVILSRSRPAGWSALRVREGVRRSSQTLARDGCFARSAADPMAHAPLVFAVALLPCRATRRPMLCPAAPGC